MAEPMLATADNIAGRSWRVHVIDKTARLPWVARCGVRCSALYDVEQYERMTRRIDTSPCPKCKPGDIPGARQFIDPTSEQYHAGEYVNLVAEHRQSFRLDSARHHVTTRAEAVEAAARWAAIHPASYWALDMRYRLARITRDDSEQVPA